MNVKQLLRFGGAFGGVFRLSPNAATESKGFVVRPRGFEPLTFCSGGKRSIRTELRARSGSGPIVAAQASLQSLIRNM